MFQVKKLLSAVLMLSLMLTLMAPAVFADAAAPLSTDYTKYPNTLSLNLKPSDADPRNRSIVKEGTQLPLAHFSWKPVYNTILPSLQDNYQKWSEDMIPGVKMLINRHTYNDGQRYPLVFNKPDTEELLPVQTLPDGSPIYIWYDGAYFYLAKDKVNVMVVSISYNQLERKDAPNRGYDPRSYDYFEEFSNKNDAPALQELCANFEAAIAAKNAAATAPVTTPVVTTDYTKYPNSLSLNLKPSEADSKNGSTPENIGKGMHYFKWTAAYESLLGSLEKNYMTWQHYGTSPASAPFMYGYGNGRFAMPDTYPLQFALNSPPYNTVDYLPTATLANGMKAYCWFDGKWFYLAKDRTNILVFGNNYDRTGAPLPYLNLSLSQNPDAWNKFNQPELSTLCENFEAAISAKNASAPITTPVTAPVTTPVTTPAVTAAPGLVAHYKFEGNLTDSSGKGHNGSEVGALAYASGGASGQALKLENGGYVKIPGASTLNLGEQFTLNAWVKLAASENDVNRYNTVLFKEHPTEPGAYIYKAVSSGTHDVRLDLQQLSTGFEPVVGTDGVGSLDLSSKWTMATWVSDGDTLYVYVDGKLQTTATTGKKEYGTPFSDAVASNLFLGGPKANSAELFNGQLDEVKLFSRALSGSEIKAEYDRIKGGGGNVIQLWIGQNRMVSDNVESTIDSAPVVMNGRTLVPVRPIIEAMGGTVAFDPATRKIDLALKGRSLTLWLDKYEAVVNGQNVTLEVAPTVIGGRTMLPLRFAAESLGASLEWDAAQQKITLKYTK